jgi:hypothetical protein
MPSLNTGNAILSNAIAVDSSYNVGIGGAASGTNKLQVTGIASANSFIPTSSTIPSNGMYLPSANTLGFSTNSSLDMVITAAGNVGIGATPSAWYTGYTALQVGFSGSIFSNRTSADTNTTMIANNAFLNSAATNWIYQNDGFATRYTQVSGGHEFYTAGSGSANGNITWGTAKMTITSGGLVELNATDATYIRFSYLGTSKAFVGVAGASSDVISGAAAGDTVIRAQQKMLFSTGGDTERMRIASNGNTAIGATDTTLAKLYVSGYGTPNSLMTQPVLSASSGSNTVQLGSDGTHALIGAGNSGSSLILLSRASGEYTQAIVIASNNTVKINNLGTGTVYSNGGVLTNTNPSDKNLKENITDLSFGLNEILKLRPVSFDWKNNLKNQSTQYGFIAQEVQKILPQLVNEFDSFEDEQTEISIKRLGLDKDAIFVSLVKAIQELTQKVNDQQQTINSLINR